MKINLLVDAAFAFDYLAILNIKCVKNDLIINKENLLFCIGNLIEEFGETLFDKIFHSKEYKNLLSANIKTFDLVDLAKQDKCLASEVDKANYERYICKTKLQKKFFKDKLTEIKC